MYKLVFAIVFVFVIVFVLVFVLEEGLVEQLQDEQLRNSTINSPPPGFQDSDGWREKASKMATCSSDLVPRGTLAC